MKIAAIKRLYNTDRNNRRIKRITKNAIINTAHIPAEVDRKLITEASNPTRNNNLNKPLVFIVICFVGGFPRPVNNQEARKTKLSSNQ